MDTGYSILTQSEEFTRNIQINVITSRQMELTESWKHDLYSPFWRLYVNNRSGAYINHEGRRIDLKGNLFWMIPAWIRFQTGIERTVVQDYIHFQLVGLPATLLRKFFSHPLSLKIDDSLKPILKKWRKGINQSDDFSHRFWSGALVHMALASFLDDFSPEEQRQCFRWMVESGDLRAAMDCIESSFSNPPSNAHLAKLCGSSEDHFIRKFRTTIGMTPAQYGLERRIAVAAERLVTTQDSLDEIAEKLGFTDRFHFSRCFSSRIGFPPATYRRLHHRQV